LVPFSLASCLVFEGQKMSHALLKQTNTLPSVHAAPAAPERYHMPWCCCWPQALDSSNPAVIKAQAALLRDRWAYFVRAAALEQHLQHPDSSSSGSEVLGAVRQVQDAAAELQQLLQQLADTAAAVVDGQQASQLQQLLTQHEAADELQELLAWCQLQGPLDASTGANGSSISSSTAAVALDTEMLEKAWRLSFAPFAAKGLAKALIQCSSDSSSSSSSSSRSRPGKESGSDVLEMTDLGLRLEDALEAAQSMRASLAAQLALNSL
jgi:DNA repair exonuclease SbcCD ATPase subunit